MTIKITPADYETKDGEYPDLHLVRSNWTPHRLFKDLFTKGHATIKPNGNYTLVDPTHNSNLYLSFVNCVYDPGEGMMSLPHPGIGGI